MRELMKTLKVLSDESRIRVLNILQERECCVCEVMQAMEISQSKASRILSALYDAGLLKLRRKSRWALYSLNWDGMKGSTKGIINGVIKALEDYPQASRDRKILKKTKRVIPG